MKQFDLQGNEYDVQIKDMIEPIPNWEYTYVYEGSRTCGKSYIQNLLDEKDKEIKKLNNVINELDTWLKEKVDSFKEDEYVSTNIEHERLAIKMVYYYLQELKGSDKQ